MLRATHRARLGRLLAWQVVVLACASIGALGPAARTAAAQGNEILAVASGGSIQAAVDQGAQDLRSGAAASVLVEVAAGFYSGNLALPGLPPTEPITIQGAGASTEVAGTGSGSVITVPAGSRVVITDLSILGGRAGQGGGVYNAGALTLQRVTVALNSAVGSFPAGIGGGIFSGGDLTLQDSTVSSNQADAHGGGVAIGATGTLNAARDAIIDNTVNTGASTLGGGGGGIALESAVAGCCSLNDSTIAGNSVQGRFGGGGGVYVSATSVRLFGDTIASNTATTGGGLSTFVAQGAEADIGGTLLAHNSPVDCEGIISPQGSDLADDASCGAGVSGGDPQLGPLANNGGPTQTMAIPATSPAYDASTLCATTDQRGISRLQLGASRCDIGAYQVSAPSTYVANRAGGSVTAYDAHANGDASPTLALAGPNTGLNLPAGVVVDVSGRVFVANAGNNSITEFASEASGNATPVASIAGAATGLSQPQDLALDASGDLFVANEGNNSITEYAPGAQGNVAPKAKIAGSSTELFQPHGVVVDPTGAVRVSNANRSINTYRAGANGNVAPRSRLVISPTSTRPFGLNVDPNGNLLVADAANGRIDLFPPGASGPAPAALALVGAPPGLSSPLGLDFDVSGDIFVANWSSNSINEYAPDSLGAALPLAVIAGPDTGLSNPAYLSEVPPPPAPRLSISSHHRQSGRALLRGGIVLTLRAFGRLAFRSGPITITATARFGRRIIAASRRAALHSGQTRLLLIPARHAGRLLRGRHPRPITVIVTIRGPAGVQTRRLTIKLIP